MGKVRASPKAEMQWFKGSQKIKEGTKFAVKYVQCSEEEYEIMLEISKPCADDGGDYKCMMKNDHGQLQAKLNLNIEAEPAPPATATPAAVGSAPTFVEKPKIVTKEEGKLIMLMVRYRAEAQCQTVWSYKETRVVETTSVKIVHERVADYFESRLELTDPAPENAGLYKCVVSNQYGEINANLSLNIEIAPIIRERPIIKKSVVLQCAVQGTQEIDVQWFKGDQAIDTKGQAKFAVRKNKSETRDGETIVQLEIEDTEVADQGTYKLVAKSETGETQSQAVQLAEEQVKMEAAEVSEAKEESKSEDTVVKKKKKKVVKKKKKKEEVKEINAPEIASYLKNFIKKEGEAIEFKCRLEEEFEEGQVKVQWFHNDVEITSNEKYLMSFDGLYASLQLVSCVMEDAGTYKVVFSNEKGSDETQGKVNVKEEPKPVEEKPASQ